VPRLPPTLHNFKFKSGPSYSKAPRGLLVQVWEGRIFTAIAISPGLSSRQSLSRSTFRAGLNSPDKEFRLKMLFLGVNLDSLCRHKQSLKALLTNEVFKLRL